MNEFSINAVAVTLVVLAVLAEVNLVRFLINEWRASRPARRAARSGWARVAPRRDFPLRGTLAACLGLPLALTAAAHAQNTTAGPDDVKLATDASAPDATEAATEKKSALSFQLNLDVTNRYFYHGIIQEDSGVIFQPAARLTANVYQHDDLKVDAFIATWNSFHGQKTAASTQGDFTEYWYESDLLGGVTITKDKFALTAQYVFLTSPSDAYETVQELNLILAYDDTDLLHKLALHPYALLAIETGADASDGANSNTGTYLELGIAPGFTWDVRETPIAISFPVSVGLSLNDYYQDAVGDDETFGFAQAGVKASLPLPFGDRYGAWTLNTGVAVLFLGDNTATYNADDDVEVIGTIGVQLNF